MELPQMNVVYLSFFIFLLATAYQYIKPSEPRKYLSLTVEKAYDRIRSGEDLTILDVRTKKEYLKNHLLKSRNIPIDDFKNHMNRIPKNKDVLIYCQTGSRSIRAIRYLEVAGYDKLLHMHEGMRGWEKAGYPTT